jgi:collagenase-like PrtC family protease
VGGASIQIVHYFDHVYLGEERSMIRSFPVTFEAKYLTCMVTRVPSYETFSLIKNNILHQSKNYKNHFENSNF